MPVSDDFNSLKAGPRGPTLLEDFVLREKIFHFDHERIPERVVHARGLAAHGRFELTASLADYTTAKVLTEVGIATPVFTRFSTVAGNRGSADVARDVRGFAVKFYTTEGNWDLVGNNIPVFFIQDAIKFPDLIHAVKEEPDRGFPQAQSAHDTFWDFIACSPEAMPHGHVADVGPHHPALGANDAGLRRPQLPAGQRQGRVDLREVPLAAGARHAVGGVGRGAEAQRGRSRLPPPRPPHLDQRRRSSGVGPRRPAGSPRRRRRRSTSTISTATKIVPEEVVPLRVIGRMTLDRNPSNVFSETEQVAFCTQNIVPGIDFSDDPLLHGRNFSYLDTQLSRLGSTNFHQLPINAPKCPFANMQRDGHMQRDPQGTRVAYTPSLIDPSGPREDPAAGFRSFPAAVEGPKARVRSATFADHYSQARQFFFSQTEPEQDHIVAALVFELSKVELPIIRSTMLGHLATIDATLGERVAAGLGHTAPIVPATPAVEPRDLPPSPKLSIIANGPPTLVGRLVGILATDGASSALVGALIAATVAAGASPKIVAPRVGGVTLDDGTLLKGDFQLAGGPSVLFDTVAVVASEAGTTALLGEAAAVGWVHDAFAHLKVIAATAEAEPLLAAAGVMADQGVVALAKPKDPAAFLALAGEGRIWAREPSVRTVY